MPTQTDEVEVDETEQLERRYSRLERADEEGTIPGVITEVVVSDSKIHVTGELYDGHEVERTFTPPSGPHDTKWFNRLLDHHGLALSEYRDLEGAMVSYTRWRDGWWIDIPGVDMTDDDPESTDPGRLDGLTPFYWLSLRVVAAVGWWVRFAFLPLNKPYMERWRKFRGLEPSSHDLLTVLWSLLLIGIGYLVLTIGFPI